MDIVSNLSVAPREVTILAAALAKIHGPCVIRNESNGYHIYMASPKCLEQDGLTELHKKHLAVNASKYLGLGKWRNVRGTIDVDRSSALCMKTSTPYSVKKLLSMPPVEQRMPGADVEASVAQAEENTAWIVEDAHGNRLPERPGDTTLITDLPYDHVARLYLRYRGFNEEQLVKQFACSYCYKEVPEDDVLGRKYRRLPSGFKDTAQGRIIFNADINGLRLAWQARVIEKTDNDVRSYWHPYKEEWVDVDDLVDGKWVARSEFANNRYFKWNISKYRTSPGAKRNEVLMGLDYVVEWNKDRTIKVAMLAEGPMDAARFPNGVCAMGKHISAQQASMLAMRFKRVVVVPDNDKAGREMLDSARAVLTGKCELMVLNVPSGVKDIGELNADMAIGLMAQYLV